MLRENLRLSFSRLSLAEELELRRFMTGLQASKRTQRDLAIQRVDASRRAVFLSPDFPVDWLTETSGKAGSNPMARRPIPP